MPPEKYFNEHPEYYSEVNGKRLGKRTQLCLTNPDVLRLVTEEVLRRIREDPNASFYGVSQNDWYNYCTCEKCKAIDDYEESHAGTMIAFVNSDFSVRKGLESATLQIAGLGYYDLFVNGNRLTDTAFPLWTPYRKRVLFDLYDLTDRIKAGGAPTKGFPRIGWGNESLPLPASGIKTFHMLIHSTFLCIVVGETYPMPSLS